MHNSIYQNSRRVVFVNLILLFFYFSNVHCQSLSQVQIIEDLDFLKKELPTRHKNLFAKISEQDFYKKIEDIKEKSKILNDESFEIELYKLTKSIGDEHTKLEPSYENVFPLQFDFFKEGIFVTNTDAINAHLRYKKLNGINKNTSRGIIKKMKTIIKDDNQSYFDVYTQFFIKNPRILKGLDIIASNQEANFILDNTTYLISSLHKKNLLLQSTVQILRDSRNDNYWYDFIADNKILYFNYQSCAEKKNTPFKLFNDQLFSDIKKKKPQKIIIDLRNNSGGNSAILDPFLNKLRTTYLNEKDKLYVLIGRHTFSSALMNAVNLKRNFNATLIGEATSGNVNHYGETRGFRLPNSRILIGYSTKYWENWKGYNGPLLPDVEVEYSIHNYRKNIDEAIEYIKKLN
ncbi:S41 family peptidase [Aquimarina rhabdastrellae]